jgi:DNA helicase-2/ATP-dependent DNA helicase PcrA
LLLTFTNKAAREMMRRVADLVGHELNELWGGTFHSIGHRILRREANLLGVERDFTIMDREDSEHLIKAVLGESEIDTKMIRFPKAEVLASIFSLALNTCKPVARVVGEQFGEFISLTKGIEDVFQAYSHRKLATACLDFDDLLVLWLRLLQEHEEARERYQRRFQFILVDEYQDTNKLQSDIIDVLAERHKNVMVVGDDAQSIYAGAGPTS